MLMGLIVLVPPFLQIYYPINIRVVLKDFFSVITYFSPYLTLFVVFLTESQLALDKVVKSTRANVCNNSEETEAVLVLFITYFSSQNQFINKIF